MIKFFSDPFSVFPPKRICWKIKVNENQCLALGDVFVFLAFARFVYVLDGGKVT